MSAEHPAAHTEPPIWVEGIGPPLQQIEQDFRELVDSTSGGIAHDGLRLAAEIRRLREALRFYAECRNLHVEWSGETQIRDRGQKAREALDRG